LGLILGYGIASLFQKLKKNSVTVATESKTFEQQEATVLLPIRPNGRGKIRLSIDGQMIDMIATTQDAEEIPIGATIIIVSVEHGTANVTEISQHHHNKISSHAHKEQPISH
jgi:membrane protein implicated in regulation of membrane protease activity